MTIDILKIKYIIKQIDECNMVVGIYFLWEKVPGDNKLWHESMTY